MAEKSGKPTLLSLLEDHHGCPICHEICFEATSTNCGHKFCKECIEKWRTETKPICPMCSTEITAITRLYSDDQLIEALLENFPSEVAARYKLEERKERNELNKLQQSMSQIEIESEFQKSWRLFREIYSFHHLESLIRLQLATLTESVCATESRFCLDHPVILTLQKEELAISSMATGAKYFSGECRRRAWSPVKETILRDSEGHPTISLRKESRGIFNIYHGDSSGKKLLHCKAIVPFFLKKKLTAKFKDAVNGMGRCVVLKGDSSDMMCTIYLGKPEQGGLPIAKIYRPIGGASVKNYHLEIGARVDIALVTVLCLGLHELAKGISLQ